MTTRRNFLRKAALGSAAFSATGGFAVLNGENSSGKSMGSDNIVIGTNTPEQVFPGWESTFEEAKSSLLIKNGSIFIQGQLSFVSGTNRWRFAKSRDGVPDRYAIIDLQDNVQGYFVFTQKLRAIAVTLLSSYSTVLSGGHCRLKVKLSFQDR